MKFLHKKPILNKSVIIDPRDLGLKLHNLCLFLHDIYDINFGGCCYLAYLIAKALEKNKFDFSVVVYKCDCDNFYDLDCGHYHYAIKLGNNIINGCNEETGNYVIFNNVSSLDLLNHYKECSNWNEYYDTHKNSLIKQIVNNFYKDFIYDLRKR